jgi:hypothetical protein
MATTTNFGWTTPDDTDLVKDGAGAIRTSLNGVDTSFVDLKGGTTGQVLAKASATDLDFVWSADAAGMTNPMTTTGDTIYSSSGSTPARLGIGTTGQVLSVAAGVPTWAAPAGGGGADFTLLNAGGTTLSGTTTTVSGISAQGSLLVIIDGGSATTGGQAFRLRLNGSTTIADYDWWGFELSNPAAYDSTALVGTTGGGDTYIPVTNMTSNNGSVVYAGISISGASTANIKVIDIVGGATTSGSNSSKSYVTKGIFSGTAAISSVSIFCGGTMDAGKVYVYGSAV